MKYIAYVRKSTDEKDKQVLSIDAQVAELKEFAKKQNLEILDFVCESRTAKTIGRPLFNKMLQRIENGEAQGILSWHADRLARNSIDGGKIIYSLDTGKLVDLKFPSFWFENSPQGKFVLNIAFGQSKYYVDNLSENVRRGLRTLLKNGVLPHKSPYGYLYHKQLKRHEIDHIKSKIIKKAFQKYGKGAWNQSQVRDFLFGNGYTRKNGKPLSLNNIYKLLTNKFYIGLFYFSGEIYQGNHQTFISKSLFESVQKQLEKKMRPSFRKRNFAFIKLIKCGECGASITAEHKTKFYKRTRGEVHYTYYRCTKKLKPCSQRFIQEPDLEKQFRKLISDIAIPQAWTPKWRELLEKYEVIEKQNQATNIQQFEEEVKTIDQKLNLLLDSYLDSTIDAGTYKQKKNELFEKKLKTQEEISRIKVDGSSWLEPMKEFINVAKDSQKIAVAKNNGEELASFAKNIGSNFFLTNRQLTVDYKKGFEALFSELSAPSRHHGRSLHSLCERDTRIELASHPWEGRILPLY